MPASAAARRTPASGGNSGSGTASGETGEAIEFSLRLVVGWLFRRGGRRLRTIGGPDGRAVQIELLHLHVSAGLGDNLPHAFLDHLLAQNFVRLLEALRRRRAAFHHLDHMPAELGMYRVLRNLARLHGEGGVGEFRYDLVLAEEAEVAALRAARAAGVLLGDRV